MGESVRIGTAGWTNEYVDWRLRRPSFEDRVKRYVRAFSIVEINSCFNKIPCKREIELLEQMTPSGFLFNVKLFKMLGRHAASPELLPEDLRQKAELDGSGNVILSGKLEEEILLRVKKSIRPLTESERLGALILQLPASFTPSRNDLNELELVLDILSDLPVVIELENKDWITGKQIDRTMLFLARKHATLAMTSAPRLIITNPQLAYFRIRNEDFKETKSKSESGTKVKLDYSIDKLQEIAAYVASAASITRNTHVIFEAGGPAFQAANACKRIITDSYFLPLEKELNAYTH